MERPCPRLPVDASTPGTFPYSGWPPRIPSGRQNFHNSLSGKKPLSARRAYSARHPCPLLKMQRSRPDQRGFAGSYFKTSSYKTRRISTRENAEPRWPRFADLTAFTIDLRICWLRLSSGVVFTGGVLVEVGACLL